MASSVPGGDVVLDRDVPPGVGHLREVADRYRDQIGRVGDVHAPVPGAPAVRLVGHLQQLAVADHHERALDGGDHLGGGAVVRRVPAREPEAVEVGLPLGPDLAGLVGIAAVGAHEVEDGLGVGGVVDRHLQAVLGAVAAVELHGQGLRRGVDGEGALGAVDAHLPDVQTGGVEHQRIDSRQEGDEGVGGGAGDAAGVPVEGEVEAQVLEVVLPRGHVARGRPLGREISRRGWDGRGEDQEERGGEHRPDMLSAGSHGFSPSKTPAMLQPRTALSA